MPNLIDIIAKPLMAITPNKEINYGPWRQLGTGALVAGASTLPFKLRGDSIKSLLPMAIGGFALGMTALPVTNALIRHKKEQEYEKAKIALRQHFFPEADPGQHLKSIATSFGKLRGFTKQAGIGTFTAKAINTTYKAGWGVTKAVAKGVFGKPTTVGEKIFGVAAKTGAIGGAAYGTYKAVDHVKNKQSYNYNTMLRNNILAGKINPAELNSSEANNVKKIGFN